MNLALDVHNLTEQFGHILAVDNISFTVNQGEIFGFLRPNGVGKTTTIRMLTGQTRPTSGSIGDPTVTYTYVIDIVALALFTIVLVAASTQILEKRIA